VFLPKRSRAMTLFLVPLIANGAAGSPGRLAQLIVVVALKLGLALPQDRRMEASLALDQLKAPSLVTLNPVPSIAAGSRGAVGLNALSFAVAVQ